MEALRIGDRQVLRLDPGEELQAALGRHLAEDSVGFAFISAAGGVSRVKLGYWNAETAAYHYQELDEQLEVLVLQGNASLKDGEPHLHLHGVFGRPDFTTVGGHVVDAVCNPTLELWLRAEEVDVRRVNDDGSGLAVLALDEPA
jgi:predicted DNA-binding protein with PD1-like motif